MKFLNMRMVWAAHAHLIGRFVDLARPLSLSSVHINETVIKQSSRLLLGTKPFVLLPNSIDFSFLSFCFDWNCSEEEAHPATLISSMVLWVLGLPYVNSGFLSEGSCGGACLTAYPTFKCMGCCALKSCCCWGVVNPLHR